MTTARPGPTLSSAALAAKVNPAGPCVMVIFGIAGDLAHRLLFPSLYHLAHDKLLAAEFAVAGFARTNLTQDGLREQMREALNGGGQRDSSVVDWLTSRLVYVRSDFNDPAGYERLAVTLRQIDEKYRTGGNYLFYLATAPEFFFEIARRLSEAGLLAETGGAWRRLIVEKPFGHDLASARELNRELTSVAAESQIYRIDHYLGKETVENILVFRFGNGVFEPIWNRRYIDHIQITVAETVGVENRAGYYDHTGALRDMVPNHLAQLLTLTTMEPPSSFAASALHNEQMKVLDAAAPLTPERCADCVIRGQYSAGISGDRPVPGYREEPGVAPNSHTETYVALKLAIDNWRWAGVPLYLRTGKRLGARRTEIVIQFYRPPLALFRSASVALPQADRLVIDIQPEESIVMEFQAKVPGPALVAAPVAMRFCYRDNFGREPRTGYETLLYDAMNGDATLFERADVIEAGWRLVQPVLDAWQHDEDGLCLYPAGSDGPQEADNLLRREGREWRPLA